MKKRLFTLSLILVLVIPVLVLNSGCADEEESNTFVDLMTLIPADSAGNGGFVLINYNNFNLWADYDWEQYSYSMGW